MSSFSRSASIIPSATANAELERRAGHPLYQDASVAPRRLVARRAGRGREQKTGELFRLRDIVDRVVEPRSIAARECEHCTSDNGSRHRSRVERDGAVGRPRRTDQLPAVEARCRFDERH